MSDNIQTNKKNDRSKLSQDKAEKNQHLMQNMSISSEPIHIPQFLWQVLRMGGNCLGSTFCNEKHHQDK